MGQRPGEFRYTKHIAQDGLVELKPHEFPARPNELPMVKVQIDLRIAMGMNEVTFGEWNECVADGGCGGYVPEMGVDTTEYSRRHPVTNINYLDALSYIDWLNTKTDNGRYRLPTEAEWEYAARAGTQTRFAQGDDLTSDQANFSGIGTETFSGERLPGLLTRGVPLSVDSLDASNPWGFRHMSGNINEFTSSCYTSSVPDLKTASAWAANPVDLDKCNPALRGGMYALAMDFNRPSSRYQDRRPLLRGNFFGFRVLREF